MGLSRYILLAVVACALTACSRLDLTPGLGLKIPFRSDLAGLANEDQLTKTVVYVHLSTRTQPLISEATYAPGSIPRGQELDLDLSNLGYGTSFFVQILMIYDNTTTGATRYFYGDTSGTVGRVTAADITTENVADTDKMITVAGRYLTGSGRGPSGELLGEFYPPNGRPPMQIGKLPIHDGWFLLKGIESSRAHLRHYLPNTDFSLTVRANEPGLTTFGPHLLKAIKPLTFSATSEPGVAKPHPASDVYVGVWGQVSGEKVCYMDINETVAGEFVNPGLSLPLEFRTSGATELNLRIAGGGVAETALTLPSAGCTLLFNHQNPRGY